LDVADKVGVGRALVTCDVDNAASAATTERCGGTFERLSRPDHDGAVVRRYWFETNPASAGRSRE